MMAHGIGRQARMSSGYSETLELASSLCHSGVCFFFFWSTDTEYLITHCTE